MTIMKLKLICCCSFLHALRVLHGGIGFYEAINFSDKSDIQIG